MSHAHADSDPISAALRKMTRHVGNPKKFVKVGWLVRTPIAGVQLTGLTNEIN